MSLITACAIVCSLKFHVVCTCTFLEMPFPPMINQKMIKIVTLMDLHTVFRWHSKFELVMLRKWQPLSCFVFIYPTFYWLKILLPNPFVFGATLAINNDPSLRPSPCSAVQTLGFLPPAPVFYLHNMVYISNISLVPASSATNKPN